MRKQIKMSKFDFNHSTYARQTSVYNILLKPETTYTFFSKFDFLSW